MNVQRMCRAYAIALLLCACGGAGTAPVNVTDVSDPLPDLTLPTLTGTTWSSKGARGKPLVIDVWASWCKPCGKAFPRLDALAARRPDVAIVAISIDEDPEAIRGFLKIFPLGVTVVQDSKQVMTQPPLSVTRLPTVLVVDGSGTIQHRVEEPTEADYDHLDPLIDHH